MSKATAAKAPKAKRRGKKRPAHRPPIELDPQRAEDFGSFAATQEEMSARLGVSVDTIRRRMQDEENEFCQAYKRGLATLKEDLRRAQIKLARRGNATMLIWLGKQLLGQQDRQYQQVEDLHGIMEKIAQAGAAARSAGDQAEVDRALATLDRIQASPESVTAVYAEWSCGSGAVA